MRASGIDRSSGYEEEKLTKANGGGMREDGKEMRDCVLYTYPGTNRLQVVVGVGRDGITTWIRKKEKMEQEMITHLVVRCEYLAMPATHPPTRRLSRVLHPVYIASSCEYFSCKAFAVDAVVGLHEIMRGSHTNETGRGA